MQVPFCLCCTLFLTCAQHHLGGQQKRVCLHTTSLQVAKGKLRQIESFIVRRQIFACQPESHSPKSLRPTSLETVKTPRNVQRDIYYLRSSFRVICLELALKNEKISQKGVKRPSKSHVSSIEVNSFEQITAQLEALSVLPSCKP